MTAADPDFETPGAAGDAEAGFKLGLEQLGAAKTFEAFDRAAALIDAAAAQGHAEATAMLATMAAVGAGRPRDWDGALNLLVVAAERGSEQARAQLRLLAGTVADPASAGETGSKGWSALRGRIELERLLEAPAPFALSERPRLRMFERFASTAECQWIVERYGPRLSPAKVWDETGSVTLDARRSNTAFEVLLGDMDVVTEIVKARISAATRLPEFIFEVPQVMRYSVGQEFRPHYDFLDPDSVGLAEDLGVRGQRIGTFLIYLNDDFEGGETQFPTAGLACRGRLGDALFFANVTPDGRPDPLTLHAGLPPTRGEKWIFSQWIRNRPPAEPTRA